MSTCVALTLSEQSLTKKRPVDQGGGSEEFDLLTENVGEDGVGQT